MTQARRTKGRPMDSPPPPKTVTYVLVSCPHCGVDLSTDTLGAVIPTPMGEQLFVLTKLRCPECKHPLLPAPKTSTLTDGMGLPL